MIWLWCVAAAASSSSSSSLTILHVLLSLPTGGIEWDIHIADAAEPPFLPNQDINAASQSAIGSFNDENQYRKVGG